MPIDMPAYAFTDLDVKPDLGMAHAVSQGGLIVTSRSADPNWRGPMTTRPLQPAGPRNEHADFRAFLSRCVDENLSVDFVHPRHRVPSAYTVENWPMVGNGALVAVTTLRNIAVSGLVAGIILRRGDRISIVQGGSICHRWVAADVTVASAINQAIALTPRLPIGVFAAGAAVVLKDPKMRVRIVPGSWDDREVAEASAISFQVMEPAL